MNKQDELYDKRTRWQETRIKQFSYVNYLVLTLALATFGFAVSLVTENDSFRNAQCILILQCHCLSLISFSVSIVLGVLCSFFRLKDFQKTSEITRLKYISGGRITSEIAKLRSKTNKFGEWSWGILWCQIGFFGAGFVFLMIAILLWIVSS